MNWTVSKIIEACNGTLLRGSSEKTLAAVSTDTRQLKSGDVFVALQGENFDGHEFIAQAVAEKAGALVVSDPSSCRELPEEVAVIAVDDTLRALGCLAGYVRRQFTIPVVGITGSNGKTSTKEMIATILEQGHTVLKSQGNFNNLIGLPLTLLQLEPIHEMAVVEMGINVLGEMEQLVAIGSPTVGLITNIQPAHLEGLSSLEEVLAEKGLLWKSLGAEGLAVVNLDDELLKNLAAELEGPEVSYSMVDKRADVHLAGALECSVDGCRFGLRIGDRQVPVHLCVLGRHHVQNALAAAATAYGLGLSAETIAAGLSLHEPFKQRMSFVVLADRTVIVDDTYNANPRSMEAAADTIQELRQGAPFIAVLGEMRELGTNTLEFHRQVGCYFGRLGLERLITYGRLGRDMGRAAVEAGLSETAWNHVESHEEAVATLRKHWVKGAWVLIKGSRGLTMENVVAGILSGQ